MLRLTPQLGLLSRINLRSEKTLSMQETELISSLPDVRFLEQMG